MLAVNISHDSNVRDNVKCESIEYTEADTHYLPASWRLLHARQFDGGKTDSREHTTISGASSIETFQFIKDGMRYPRAVFATIANSAEMCAAYSWPSGRPSGPNLGFTCRYHWASQIVAGERDLHSHVKNLVIKCHRAVLHPFLYRKLFVNACGLSICFCRDYAIGMLGLLDWNMTN